MNSIESMYWFACIKLDEKFMHLMPTIVLKTSLITALVSLQSIAHEFPNRNNLMESKVQNFMFKEEANKCSGGPALDALTALTASHSLLLHYYGSHYGWLTFWLPALQLCHHWVSFIEWQANGLKWSYMAISRPSSGALSGLSTTANRQ